VSLFEESRSGGGKPHVRFCEGPGPTGVWLKYRGTAGKPGGKRRKQTSTCSIGRNRSTRLHIHLIITGRVIDAQEALRIGLANEVVPKGTSLERSFELARFICTMPQPAIRTDKEAAVRGFGLPLTASVNASRRLTVGQIFSKDYDSPDLSDPWLILHYGCVN